MTANGTDALALDNYQRAARVILSNHLVTRTYPDRIALPLVRRWATELRDDLADLFGYRLEVTETTARLFPVIDRLDASQPARTATERVFDRRRYAYLALALAALGRSGDQITLSELADHVAADTLQIEGLDLATDRASDRDAFVDAVGWLATRGAITLADGDASGWASDPEAGEALYDIDRSVVHALFRPPRVLQHLHSVRGLLAGDALDDESPADPAETARRVRRALVERPVVYTEDLAAEEVPLLSEVVTDVELFTGLRTERRAEGVALIDTSGRMSDVRFPSTGTVAQVALLLAGEIADRVLDVDLEDVRRLPITDASIAMAAQLDSAIPESTVFEPLADSADERPLAGVAGVRHVFVEQSWLLETVTQLTHLYGKTFAAQWQADTRGLLAGAVALLDKLRLVHAVDGGVLALPALARYRGAVVTVRSRVSEPALFEENQ